MNKRTLWGPIQWDGTLAGMRKCVEAFERANVPDSARIIVGQVSYAGSQLTARTDECRQSPS